MTDYSNKAVPWAGMEEKKDSVLPVPKVDPLSWSRTILPENGVVSGLRGMQKSDLKKVLPIMILPGNETPCVRCPMAAWMVKGGVLTCWCGRIHQATWLSPAKDGEDPTALVTVCSIPMQIEAELR